jgi:hypothetical protein
MRRLLARQKRFGSLAGKGAVVKALSRGQNVARIARTAAGWALGRRPFCFRRFVMIHSGIRTINIRIDIHILNRSLHVLGKALIPGISNLHRRGNILISHYASNTRRPTRPGGY